MCCHYICIQQIKHNRNRWLESCAQRAHRKCTFNCIEKPRIKSKCRSRIVCHSSCAPLQCHRTSSNTSLKNRHVWHFEWNFIVRNWHCRRKPIKCIARRSLVLSHFKRNDSELGAQMPNKIAHENYSIFSGKKKSINWINYLVLQMHVGKSTNATHTHTSSNGIRSIMKCCERKAAWHFGLLLVQVLFLRPIWMRGARRMGSA